MPPVSALQRLLHWSLTSLLLLTLVACSGIQIDEGCKRTVQPVCGVVEPAFCSIDEPSCGPFRQTFRNVCWARAAEAADVRRGACRPTGHGAIPDPIDDPEAAPQIAFETPIPPSGFRALEGLPPVKWVDEPVSDTSLGLKLRGVRVQTRRVRQDRPEVVLVVSGRVLNDCKRPDLIQAKRIDDTFYVELSSYDLREQGLPCRDKRVFAQSLKLNPGPDPLVIGQRYTVIINGKKAAFLVRDPRRNELGRER